MNEPAEKIARLIAGYIQKTLTSEEHDELDTWVNESDDNMRLFEELTDEKNINAGLQLMAITNTEEAYNKLVDNGALKKLNPPRNIWIWISAASIVIAVLIFAGIQYEGKKPIAVTPKKTGLPTANADSNSVLLQLANGMVVNLSEAADGWLELGQRQQMQKTNDSTLTYTIGGSTAVQTLTTPAGKQFQVQLNDGTKVWLNAASSLTYNGNFTDKERTVKLNGEAYFEVAPDSKRPFKVFMKDSAVVTVLGTHFNISAYPNQVDKAVTLLEGTVAVSTPLVAGTTLKPGAQALINKKSIRQNKHIDIETIMAWKQGLFIFKDASLAQMMEQIKVWYGVKIVYEGATQQLFNARFSRTETLEQILKTLELNGHLSFTLKNNTLYVLPR